MVNLGVSELSWPLSGYTTYIKGTAKKALYQYDIKCPRQRGSLVTLITKTRLKTPQ